MTGFRNDSPLSDRPTDPVIVIHARVDIDDDWHDGHIDAARAAFQKFAVIGLRGYSADVSILTGRDVVFWPWMGAESALGHLQHLASLAARVATRTRIIGGGHGPTNLNGFDPMEYARSNAVIVEPAGDHAVADLEQEWFGGEPDPEERPLVSSYAAHHPDMIEETWPEPVDLFTKRALPPLRKDDLPPSIADFIFDQSEIIGADPCILAVSCLVTAASVTHDSIKLQAQRHNYGWTESARLWGAFVGDPSVKKTPALSRAIAHVKKLNIDMAQSGAAEMELYKRQTKDFERSESARARNEANGRSGGHSGEPPAKPPMKRLLTQDATPEALGVILKDNPGGILMLHDELSGFFGSMDAYRSQGGKDASFWLETYNGGPHSIDRITRDSILIPNISTCVLGGIQPSALAKIAKALPDDGLLQRFMVVIAQPIRGDGQDRPPNQQAVDGWRSIIDWLVRERGASQPVLMSDEALKIRATVADAVESLRDAHAGTPRLASHLGKWNALFIRLCLTYHALQCADQNSPVVGEISKATAQRVARFMVDYLFEHLRAFHEDLLGDSAMAEHARWIAGYVLSRGLHEVTLRDIYRASKRFAKLEDKDRQAVMKMLEFCGWTRGVKGSNPGAPTQLFEVNPRVHVAFAEHANTESESRLSAREMLVAKATRQKAERNE